MKKERSHIDKFGIARLDAIFEARKNGKTSPDELAEAANIAQVKAVIEIGRESESKFDEYSSRFKIFTSVNPSTEQEDIHLKIDRWVTLKEKLFLPKLPVQIKSSMNDVRLFKYGNPESNTEPSSGFTDFKGLIMVINCGPSVTYKSFRRQVYEEVSRIMTVLDNNPQYIKLIELHSPEDSRQR